MTIVKVYPLSVVPESDIVVVTAKAVERPCVSVRSVEVIVMTRPEIEIQAGIEAGVVMVSVSDLVQSVC